MESHTHKYPIEHQWDGTPIDHAPITVAISKDPNNAMFVILETEAPFFNDPGSPPQGEPGQTYDGLWEYEGKNIELKSILMLRRNVEP